MTDALRRRDFRTPLLILLAMAAIVGCGEREPVPETPPRLEQPVPAEAFPYPEELRDEGVEGRTVVRVHIDTAGRVDSARVETPSQHAAFDSVAVAGSRRLRFVPARRGGEAVARWYHLPVRFDLTPAAGTAGQPTRPTP